MRLLLDTQVFIWSVVDSKKLRRRARTLITEADETFVSAVSIWEIAIKARLGRLDADPAQMVEAIAASGFRELTVNARHAAAVNALPRHHNDPFDHLLLAQAITEPMRLLTADPLLPPYSELVLRA